MTRCGYGCVIWLFRKSIRNRFTSSFPSPSFDGWIRPCFCFPEGPFSQFYITSPNQTHLMDEIKQKLPSFHFVHENECYGLLTNLCFFILVLNKLDFTSLLFRTRIKSMSFLTFLCSLHTWMSWVINGLIDTSLELSGGQSLPLHILTIIDLFGISTSYRSGHHWSTDSRI